MNWNKAITEFRKAHEENQNIQTNFKKTQIPGQEKPIKKNIPADGLKCLSCQKIYKGINQGKRERTMLVICDCGKKLIWNYELTENAKIINQV